MPAPSAPKRSLSRRSSSLRAALSALALAAAFSVPAHGEAMDAFARGGGGLEAKLTYCKTCHGTSAQGYRGWFMIPRLAGQNVQYIENQLHAFTERRRTNPIMQNVAHALNPSMMSALADYFHHLEARPIGGAPRSTALGKKIFEEGLPDSNVPACYVCHGPEGRGQNEIPRLAGQLYEYVVGQLTNWAKVRGQGTAVDTSAIMVPTAHNMTRAQIEAVAAYVSNMQ